MKLRSLLPPALIASLFALTAFAQQSSAPSSSTCCPASACCPTGTCYFMASCLSPPAYGSEAHVYRCPMHPWIKSDPPGKCTICGMDLVSLPAANSATQPGGITLAASQIAALGVQTSVVAHQPLTRTLR